ncbi:MAG TPA: oligopeptide ABC transporter substrate-binding protein [Virgibacillus sp.]|nr:oligopeptide ABC transporter substrate-binding protein [Virgibacillus sp.]
MRKSLVRLLLAAMLVLTLALAACGGDSDDDNNNNNNNEPNTSEENNNNNDNNDNNNNDEEEEALSKEEEIMSRFEQTASNTDEPLEDGHLNFGLVTNSPFAGVLNANFYSGAPDAEVINWFDEGMLGRDGDFLYDQTGIATFEHDEEGKVFTFEIEKGVKYHDGEELTVDDWILAHEVIAHPDYEGPRFDATLRNVEGIEEYHNGEAEEISGLKKIDDYTLEMTFKEATPSLLAGGIWTSVLPSHIFGDMEVAEMEESDAVRENPIGLGPYMVDTIVPGESVTYKRFDDYWRGTPALESITLKVIPSANAGKALESGEVDMLDSFPASQFPEYQDLENVEFLANVDNYYSYLGFKLGDWDHDEGQVNMDLENSRVGDKALRQAIAYAFDGDVVGEKFFNDIHWAANSLIDPGHRLYHDPSWEGYDYDPDKANELLDEAGYEYDGDFRTYPDGSELVLTYAAMDSSDMSEPMANYLIQSWEEIGIKVEKLDGRLHEFNDFYDRVGEKGEDDPEIDIFQGAWSTGTNVDPSGLFGKEAIFNFSRFESDESDELIAKGLSEEAFDLDYRKEVYAEWHELMMEELPVIPLTFSVALTPINKRVTNVTVDPDVKSYRYEIGVTEEEPFTE